MGYKLALLGTVTILIQSISSQFIGSSLNAGARGIGNGYPYGPNPAANPFGNNLAGKAGPIGLPGCTASTGGSFAVTSKSPVSPVGVSVLAENLAIEGPLTVGGNLPFLGTVGIEGTMPNAGVGSVSYGCGNGNVGITSENAAGFPGPYGLAGSPPASGPYNLGSAGSIGSYGSVANGVSSYGLAGSPSGFAGPFGSVGSPIGPSGFGSGLGLSGFKGVR